MASTFYGVFIKSFYFMNGKKDASPVLLCNVTKQAVVQYLFVFIQKQLTGSLTINSVQRAVLSRSIH